MYHLRQATVNCPATSSRDCRALGGGGRAGRTHGGNWAAVRLSMVIAINGANGPKLRGHRQPLAREVRGARYEKPRACCPGTFGGVVGSNVFLGVGGQRRHVPVSLTCDGADCACHSSLPRCSRPLLYPARLCWRARVSRLLCSIPSRPVLA